MHIVPGMVTKPLSHRGMFVGPVIVQHDVYFQTRPDGRFNTLQKEQEFLVPVSRLALADNCTVENIESGKQCGRTMPLVIMGLSLRKSRTERQNGLGAIQRLNLTLFVDA